MASRLDRLTAHWRRDLRIPLLSIYLLVVGLVLVVAWVFIRRAEVRLVADVGAADKALVQSLALETETSLHLARQAIAALAEAPAVQARDPAGMRALFRTAMEARQDLVLVYLLDADGTMLYHYPEGPGSTLGWNFSFRDYFQAALRTDRPVLSKGRISPTTGKPVVTAAMPLRDEAGRFRGLVAMNLALERLSEALQAIVRDQATRGHNVSLSIFDHTGQLIADADTDRLLDKTYSLPTWPGSEAPSDEPFWAVFSDAPGQRAWLYTYARLPESGWVVMVRRPADQAMATLQAFRHGWLLAMLLFPLGGAAFWTFLSRSVLTPLEQLATYSRGLGRRRYIGAPPDEVKLLARRADQIGHLTRSMRLMQADLERRFQELATLLETSRAVLSTLEARQVIDTILEQVQRLLDVRICSLFVYDPQARIYRVQATRGLSPGYAARVQLQPDDERSPTMQALRERRPVQVADVEKAPVSAALRRRARQEGYRALLAIPLLTREAPPAALVLYHTRPHRFSEEEIELALHFAHHAAMALEHAVLYAQSDHLRYLQTLRLEAVIQSVHDGLILESLEGKILYINRQAGRFLSCDVRRAVGQPADLLLRRCLGASHIPTGASPYEPLEVIVEVGGEKRDLRLLSVVVREEDGTPVGRVHILRDITAEKRLDRAKSALLSAVSHELRTPLAAIKGYVTSLLADDVEWDPDTQREFLEIVNQEADRLQRLVTNLLDLSRLEAGTLTLRQDAILLTDLLERAVRDVDFDDHPVRVEVPPHLPPVNVDAARIEVVLHNLLENAVKHTPPGTPIQVTAGIADGQVLVRVADRGPGVRPEHRERIFDRFYRAPGVRASGAGLGLAICKGFVEAHGGRIWVEESPGGGATFAFTLPIHLV